MTPADLTPTPLPDEERRNWLAAATENVARGVGGLWFLSSAATLRLLAEHDALAAQIEAAKDIYDRAHWEEERMADVLDRMIETLSASPSQVVARIREAAWDEGVDAAVAWSRSCSGESADAAADYIEEMAVLENPYRQEAQS